MIEKPKRKSDGQRRKEVKDRKTKKREQKDNLAHLK